MTAYIVLSYDDHLAVYSDGATYDKDGIYRAPKNKVDVFPHANAMLMTRGSGAMGEMLKMKLGTYDSFSDMKIMLATEMLGAAVAAHGMFGEDVNMTAILAGIPDYDGPPEIHAAAIEGESPWERAEGSLEVHDVGRFFAIPGLHDDDYQRSPLPGLEKSETAEEYYIAYMEQMRRIPRLMHRDTALVGCNIGAFVQKTVLAKGEAGTRILHRWPDIIGQPLNGVQPYVEEKEAA